MESQYTEWKETWRDEYIKTICAFANANGGVFEIGRDDSGNIVGLDNANVKKLMEDLPNKIRSATGVVADIDLRRTSDKHCIAVSVKPYTFPISCRGKYYYRSGSTTQELSGNSLDEFFFVSRERHGMAFRCLTCKEWGKSTLFLSNPFERSYDWFLYRTGVR